jgi:arylsulfatase A-like enzyme
MSEQEKRYPNILLVVIDSLRAGNLGIYTSGNGLTPNVDEVAAGGALFEDAYSTWNTTDQALTTILTGKYPLSHGIVHHGDRITREDLATFERTGTRTLAEILEQHGYETIAVDWMGRWFKKGFKSYGIKSERRLAKKISSYTRYVANHVDIFFQYKDTRRLPIPSPKDAMTVLRTFLFTKMLAQVQDASYVTESALESIKSIGKGRFFLFLHYWDTHTPYNCPKEYQTYHGLDTRKRLIHRYDGAIQYVDHQLGRLFHELKARNLWDNTIVIITSDHGESLTEHDIFFDHHGLYDVTIRVPLILRYPKISQGPKRIKGLVQHVDLMPTLLAILGMDTEKGSFDGANLLPLIENKVKEIRPFVYCEESYAQKKRALRTRRHKYICATDGIGYCSYCHKIHGGSEELYDLEKDPSEQINIVEQNPRIRRDLRKRLEDFVRRLALKRQGEIRERGLRQPDERIYDYSPEEQKEIEKKLRSFGYIE